MRICFVSRGTLHSFWDDYGGSDADILFFGFQSLGEVSYEKELKGETDFFEDVAILSKENHNVVVCGCVTDTRGLKRKSAVVAENGRILGVSDMLNAVDGEYSSGAGLRVYETRAGRLASPSRRISIFPSFCAPWRCAEAISCFVPSVSFPISPNPCFCGRRRFPTACPCVWAASVTARSRTFPAPCSFPRPTVPWNFPLKRSRNITSSKRAAGASIKRPSGIFEPLVNA